MIPILLAGCTAVPSGPPAPGEPVGPVVVAQGIQIGEEGDGLLCDTVESPVDDAFVSAGDLTFSAEAFLSSLPTDGRVATLQTVDGAESRLEVEAQVDGEVRLVTRIGRLDGAVCDGAWYRVDLIVSLSAPPAIDERLRTWAEARTADAPTWIGAVPLDQVGGAMRPQTLDGWDAVFLDLPGWQEPDGSWSGDLVWRGQTGDVWTAEPAGSWSSPP